MFIMMSENFKVLLIGLMKNIKSKFFTRSMRQNVFYAPFLLEERCHRHPESGLPHQKWESHTSGMDKIVVDKSCF